MVCLKLLSVVAVVAGFFFFFLVCFVRTKPPQVEVVFIVFRGLGGKEGVEEKQPVASSHFLENGKKRRRSIRDISIIIFSFVFGLSGKTDRKLGEK